MAPNNHFQFRSHRTPPFGRGLNIFQGFISCFRPAGTGTRGAHPAKNSFWQEGHGQFGCIGALFFLIAISLVVLFFSDMDWFENPAPPFKNEEPEHPVERFKINIPKEPDSPDPADESPLLPDNAATDTESENKGVPALEKFTQTPDPDSTDVETATPEPVSHLAGDNVTTLLEKPPSPDIAPPDITSEISPELEKEMAHIEEIEARNGVPESPRVATKGDTELAEGKKLPPAAANKTLNHQHSNATAIKIEKPNFGQVEDTSKGDRQLKSIRFMQTDGGAARITFELNGFFPPVIGKIGGEKPRLVCDFMNTRALRGIQSPIVPDLEIVKKIRMGIHNNPRPKLRVVLDLVRNFDYTVAPIFETDKNSFILHITTTP
jgi:hypothetical protein